MHLTRRPAHFSVMACLTLVTGGLAAIAGAGSAHAALPPGCSQAGAQVTCTYTADTTFVVPSDTTSLRVRAVGGNGAAGSTASSGVGGTGDDATSDLPVNGSILTAGQTLTIKIGGNAFMGTGGANGGGAGGAGPTPGGTGGGGGGATEVRGPSGSDPRLVVAGGGGGGGVTRQIIPVTFIDGGDGGSAHLTGDGRNGGDGENVGDAGLEASGGGGGVGSTGGAAGVNANAASGDPVATAGDNGTATGTGGHGGNGPESTGTFTTFGYSGAGGGGGGYVGGGGGGGGHLAGAGGGAAGTSFTAGTVVSNAASNGTPRVVISYQVPAFATGPTATISGLPRVGTTLTAGEGNPSPTPDSYQYQWYADGVAIGSATNKTFTLTSAQIGKVITVQVTAIKAGLDNASDTSDPTAPVGSLVAKHLDLETSSSTYAGNSISVVVKGLSKYEAYTIRVDDEVVKTGTANSDGRVSTKITVPLSFAAGSHTISATGAFPDREDTDSLKLKSPSDLDVDLDDSSVKKGRTQEVEVDDLLKGEKVEVRYDGNLISPPSAKGASDGEYELTFNVGSVVGTHHLKVTGTYDGRTTNKSFKVTN